MLLAGQRGLRRPWCGRLRIRFWNGNHWLRRRSQFSSLRHVHRRRQITVVYHVLFFKFFRKGIHCGPSCSSVIRIRRWGIQDRLHGHWLVDALRLNRRSRNIACIGPWYWFVRHSLGRQFILQWSELDDSCSTARLSDLTSFGRCCVLIPRCRELLKFCPRPLNRCFGNLVFLVLRLGQQNLIAQLIYHARRTASRVINGTQRVFREKISCPSNSTDLEANILTRFSIDHGLQVTAC